MNISLQAIIEKYKKDKTRLLDILIDIQLGYGYISDKAITEIARQLDMAKIDVEQTISFYHFLSQKPRGKTTIYLDNSVVACMMGRDDVRKAFEQEAGCNFGEVTSDGLIGLYDTPCIGMSDQGPAALINGEVFTKLTPSHAKQLIQGLKAGKNSKDLFYQKHGDGRNSSKEIYSMVQNNIQRKGTVIFDDFTPGQTILKILPSMAPTQVIKEIKDSGLRGRGGAGFPTGYKWEFCRKSKGKKHYIICNADEGEPGTFKDRVILTERPEMLVEGMIIGGYAVGAKEGILYLRYEYKYMVQHLKKVLQEYRNNNLLGKNIGGINGFHFNIRIQLGAGSYVCGEESALIESLEGKRGEPRDKPPFPVEKGYLNMPTVVNNVETLCAAARILINGAEWHDSIGTKDSTGTKILSISGDCKKPGIYEIDWGMTITEMLEMAGAENVKAVQAGGPSGALIGIKEFNRKICYEDLATGGSMIIIGNHRDLLKDVVLPSTNFFIEESCGSCSTCRIIPALLKNKLKKILAGRGVKQDIEDIIQWAEILKVSRCGLGQTAANPILFSIKNFKRLYETIIQEEVDFDTGFDLNKAMKESCKFVGRTPVMLFKNGKPLILKT